MKNSSTENQFSAREVYSILGLPFDVVTRQEAIEKALLAIKTKQRCFLTTPNLNFLITAQRDKAFYQSVIESDLSIADGMPIVWIAKLLGIPIKERVAGSDLFAGLSDLKPKDKKIRVFFFGGQEGIAEQACAELNANSRGMSCCGFYDPGFVPIDGMSTPAIIATINQAKPDFLVVALGAAKGQAWIQKNRQNLNAPVISHLGAVINFVAGHVERAPVFWQKTGLEWLWRIKQEPLLWKRYFFDGLQLIKLCGCHILPLMLYQRLVQRNIDSNQELKLLKITETELHLSGYGIANNLPAVKLIFDEIIKENKAVDIHLNVADLIYIDAAMVSLLLLFQNTLQAQNRRLYLHHTSPRIKRLLRMHKVLERLNSHAILNNAGKR